MGSCGCNAKQEKLNENMVAEAQAEVEEAQETGAFQEELSALVEEAASDAQEDFDEERCAE